MDSKFGIVNVSLSFDIDLDDLADALEYQDKSLEEMIRVGKENFVDTVQLMNGADIFAWVDVTPVIEGEEN